MPRADSENQCARMTFADVQLAQQLIGEQNANVQRLAAGVGVKIDVRGNSVAIQGDAIACQLARNVLRQLYGLLKSGYPVYGPDVDQAVAILAADAKADLRRVFLDTVYVTAKKRAVTPKSPAQKAYIDAMRESDMVFGIGPAGTGKTYLAMAMAVASLTKGLVNRIILTRPAVEAGEALGFLPGDLAEKVDPYLRPLYDALHDMVRFERANSLIQQGVIEVAPLAFMRGRTLNDAFVILDEAQNTTGEQMKMFLTRIGFNSKAVITGDITQTDLPEGKVSGLVQGVEILKHIDGIRFIYFSKQDVVRHRLVQAIIQAYEDHDRRLRQSRNASA
ncbi:MAG: PhoH family protein [Deltaproteobacteria bacterium]|nr:PhoH family protein [Deltaproteobacteria bacterium]MBW2356945.1 PhoH family protein [Deltaproteobacteria bacterium]